MKVHTFEEFCNGTPFGFRINQSIDHLLSLEDPEPERADILRIAYAAYLCGMKDAHNAAFNAVIELGFSLTPDWTEWVVDRHLEKPATRKKGEQE